MDNAMNNAMDNAIFAYFDGSTSPTSSVRCALISSTTMVYPVKLCRVLKRKKHR